MEMFHVYSQNRCEYHVNEYFVRRERDMETLMEHDTLSAFRLGKLVYVILRCARCKIYAKNSALLSTPK